MVGESQLWVRKVCTADTFTDFPPLLSARSIWVFNALILAHFKAGTQLSFGKAAFCTSQKYTAALHPTRVVT